MEGFVTGEMTGYLWEARLCNGPVSYGIDPVTLYKGYGRIAYLALYERLGDGAAARRRVAVFDRGWWYGRRRHLSLLADLVRSLDAPAAIC